jgi:hypothetical protein
MVLAHPSANCRAARTASLQVLSQALEERVPHLTLRRFGEVLDLGKQLRFYPDAFVRDALGTWLRRADERRLAQDSRPAIVELLR